MHTTSIMLCMYMIICYLTDLPHSSSCEVPPAKRMKYEHSDGMHLYVCVCCVVNVMHYVLVTKNQEYICT